MVDRFSHYSRKYLIILLCLSPLTILNCQKIRVAEQNNGQVTLPEYPLTQDGVPLYLTTDDFSNTYYGQFLVWNNSVTPQDMSQVIDTTYDYYDMLIKELNFHKTTLNPLKRQIAGTQQQLAVVKNEKNAKCRGFRLTAAAKWWKQRVAAPVLQSMASNDKNSINLAFQKYCEAKLWEYTLISDLAERTFSEQPTPLALCENVYKKLGLLLPETENCVNHGDNQKNYFACFWREGVLKTSLFLEKYLPEDQQLIVDVKNEDLRKSLIERRKTGLNGLKRILFQNVKSRLQLNNGDTLKFKATIDTEGKSARDWLDNFEPEIAENSSLVTMLPENPATLKVEFKNLINDLTLFAKFNELNSNISDIVFNNPIETSVIKPSTSSIDEPIDDDLLKIILAKINKNLELSKKKFKLIFEATDPVLDQKINSLQTDLSLTEQELKDAEATVNTPNLDNEDEIQNWCDEHSENIGCQLRNLFVTRVNIATRDSVSLTLLPDMEVKINNVGDMILEIDVKLDYMKNSKTIRGCYSIAREGPVACPSIDELRNIDRLKDQLNLEQDVIEAEVTMNRDSGRLRVGLDLASNDLISAIGLKLSEQHKIKQNLEERERSSDTGDINFNLLSSEDILDSRFELELFPVVWGDIVNVLTGNIFFKDEKNKPKYSGNMYLLEYYNKTNF